MKTNRLIFAGSMMLAIALLYALVQADVKRIKEQQAAAQALLRKTMYLNNGHYALQVNMWKLSKMEKADIVMLGNSHTFYANWAELLNRPALANRGIPGDITLGYLHRMEYVYALQPKVCFIEGGVNDFYSGYSLEEVTGNYKQLINELLARKINPVIQATFLVGTYWPEYEEKNEMIVALNQQLQCIAKEKGLMFIDINPFIAPEGFLRPELTYDGLHLNAQGYEIWLPAVAKALETLGL
jgi:lysophospholipase L1-like esterase